MRMQQFKCIIILLVGLVCSNEAMAQQDPQYTQYMYNPININPGYAGSRGTTSIFLLHRAQWVGLEGAPVTNTASLNAPVGRNVGLGLTFINDKIGPTDTNLFSADFSYTLKVNDYYKLGLGIKGSLQLFNVDFTKLNIYDPSDPRFQTNINNQLTPNVGAGAFLYSDATYFGLSVPNILETQHYEHNEVSVAKERFHVYAMGGHVFDLAYNWKFKPAALAKVVQGAPVQLDLTANVLYNDKFTVGVAYRWDAAVSALAGFQVSDKLFIGYTYDTETTALADYNSGSHEIFLRFELFKKYEKVMNPRFF
ncbi:type IX secretion system membrane protein PorP/SprF [Flavobacterium sp. AG291]|uniref:PorP/SprF family type IX secretion system membrane protein n=1 Tax=Flavobacterium sp. AG291 TaxID=2184000 RepID=UPI000E0BD8BC|nr:type IX secretion system membrane protein PorP/SprF [Flavobacterium sp. AG291]RDI09708.1 type IX secretion system PorP/SprF family membrane protein [Flavobacterium sp. AG291]